MNKTKRYIMTSYYSIKISLRIENMKIKPTISMTIIVTNIVIKMIIWYYDKGTEYWQLR